MRSMRDIRQTTWFAPAWKVVVLLGLVPMKLTLDRIEGWNLLALLAVALGWMVALLAVAGLPYLVRCPRR